MPYSVLIGADRSPTIIKVPLYTEPSKDILFISSAASYGVNLRKILAVTRRNYIQFYERTSGSLFKAMSLKKAQKIVGLIDKDRYKDKHEEKFGD